MKKPIGFFLSFIGPFLFYSFTAAHQVTMGDAGEFITAACSLGIPHPPGFPLYVVLGKLFCLLPFGTAAYRISLLSAFFGALTCMALFGVMMEIGLGVTASLGAVIVLAFSQVFSSVSRSVEVYTLHSFILGATFWVALCYRQRPKPQTQYFLFFLMGLGLVHHWPLMAVGLPSLALLVFPTLWKRGLKKLPLSLLFLFLPLFLYLLLPWFSERNPVMDWGHTQNWNQFWIHVLRLATSESEPGWQPVNRWLGIAYFGKKVLLEDTAWVGLVLAAYGAFAYQKKDAFLVGSLLAGWLVPFLVIVTEIKISWTGPMLEATWVTFSSISFFLAALAGLGFAKLAPTA